MTVTIKPQVTILHWPSATPHALAICEALEAAGFIARPAMQSGGDQILGFGSPLAADGQLDDAQWAAVTSIGEHVGRQVEDRLAAERAAEVEEYTADDAEYDLHCDEETAFEASAWSAAVQQDARYEAAAEARQAEFDSRRDW
jgi:hypothetical protein